MGEQLNRQQILGRLRELSVEKKTGTFFANTPDKHIALIVFNDGDITSLSYAQIRGVKALEKLSQLDNVSCYFQDVAIGSPQIDLPTTADILAQWENGQVVIEQDSVSAGFPWEPFVKEIATILARYAGPIAPVLAKSIAAKIKGRNAGSAMELIGQLASDIGNRSDQQKFLVESQNLLKKLG